MEENDKAAKDLREETSAFSEAIHEAERALTSRPTISIRLRLVVAFLLCFFFTGAVVVASVIILHQITSKLSFLETTGSLRYELQQARRYEKNYFLYGTDIEKAAVNAKVAGELLDMERGNVLEVAGEVNLEALTQHLGHYIDLLEACSKKDAGAEWKTGEKKALERELREHGSRLISLSESLRNKERKSIDGMLRVSETVSFIFLGVLLLLIIFFLRFLVGAIVSPLKRFQGYYRRIAEGDFTPIAPARRYRDEFSDLALALNRMLLEIKSNEVHSLQAAKMAAIETLSFGIAHELNNPLNNVAITTEALMEDLDSLSNEEKRKYLQDIYFENERAAETVKNLLDFTRIQKPERVPLDIREVVSSTRRLVANEMSIHGVDFSMDIPDGLPKVLCALGQLRQIFLNLFINAVQAMGDGGLLKVIAGLDEESVAVKVKIIDTGVGIPKENIPHLFEPFFTTKPPGEGTGLGLSVTYGIIKKHGGNIEVESVPGQGTTFTVTLPVANREEFAGGEQRP